MSDIAYPLQYSNNSILLLDNPNDISYSHVLHFINTIINERILFPNYGINLNLLFSSTIPEILTDSIKFYLKTLENIDVSIVLISYQNGILKLRLTVANTSGEISVNV